MAFTGGYLDAVSYRGLGRVFTANMTGNTVLLGIAIVQRDMWQLLRSLTALLGFCGGVVIATLLVRSDQRRVWRALAAQCVALLVLAGIWSATGEMLSLALERVLIALSAISMGMQTEAAR